jgi:F-type H+-transporting ATPase subunit delta
MTNKTAATRYARALLDVAVKETDQGAGASGSRDALQQIEEELAGFVDLFTQHPTLAKVLLNPAVPVKRKQATVAELTGRLKTSSILAKLIMLLAERDRLVLLPDLLASYRERLLDHQQVVRAEVTTAVPLAADRTRAIEQGLAQLTGRTVTLATKVNPSIIGGVVARIGSTVYDGSVTTQLQKMKQRLVESV